MNEFSMKDPKDSTFGTKDITNTIRDNTIDSSLIRLLEQSIDQNYKHSNIEENSLRQINITQNLFVEKMPL